MSHFTRRRIKAHIRICFVALKVYKELERLLKPADINMSVDKVPALAQTIVTIQLTLPQSRQTISRTMLMKRHQRIATLFDEVFLGDTMTKSGACCVHLIEVLVPFFLRCFKIPTAKIRNRHVFEQFHRNCITLFACGHKKRSTAVLQP